MGRRIQGYGDTFDPDTLKLLARAFDAAWRDIKNDVGATQTDDRRTRLALVILALAHEGARNEREIRRLAVKYMNAVKGRVLMLRGAD